MAITHNKETHIELLSLIHQHDITNLTQFCQNPAKVGVININHIVPTFESYTSITAFGLALQLLQADTISLLLKTFPPLQYQGLPSIFNVTVPGAPHLGDDYPQSHYSHIDLNHRYHNQTHLSTLLLNTSTRIASDRNVADHGPRLETPGQAFQHALVNTQNGRSITYRPAEGWQQAPDEPQLGRNMYDLPQEYYNTIEIFTKIVNDYEQSIDFSIHIRAIFTALRARVAFLLPILQLLFKHNSTSVQQLSTGESQRQYIDIIIQYGVSLLQYIYFTGADEITFDPYNPFLKDFSPDMTPYHTGQPILYNIITSPERRREFIPILFNNANTAITAIIAGKTTLFHRPNDAIEPSYIISAVTKHNSSLPSQKDERWVFLNAHTVSSTAPSTYLSQLLHALPNSANDESVTSLFTACESAIIGVLKFTVSSASTLYTTEIMPLFQTAGNTPQFRALLSQYHSTLSPLIAILSQRPDLFYKYVSQPGGEDDFLNFLGNHAAAPLINDVLDIILNSRHPELIEFVCSEAVLNKYNPPIKLALIVDLIKNTRDDVFALIFPYFYAHFNELLEIEQQHNGGNTAMIAESDKKWSNREIMLKLLVRQCCHSGRSSSDDDFNLQSYVTAGGYFNMDISEEVNELMAYLKSREISYVGIIETICEKYNNYDILPLITTLQDSFEELSLSDQQMERDLHRAFVLDDSNDVRSVISGCIRDYFINTGRGNIMTVLSQFCAQHFLDQQ